MDPGYGAEDSLGFKIPFWKSKPTTKTSKGREQERAETGFRHKSALRMKRRKEGAACGKNLRQQQHSSEKTLARPIRSPQARAAHSRSPTHRNQSILVLQLCSVLGRSSQGKYSLCKCHGDSSQAAAGLKVSSAPYGRSEQCSSMAATTTDKIGSMVLRGQLRVQLLTLP